MKNGFWNTIGWLNDKFGKTLTVLGFLGGLSFLLGATPLGIAFGIIAGVAGLIGILNYFRPNKSPQIL